MHTGMLWFNKKTLSLNENIQAAIEYYQKRFGKNPDLCLVHPSTYQPIKIEGLTLRTYRPILPSHIWIGVEDKS